MRSLPSDSFLSQWIAFDRIEPFGDEWEQTARLHSAIVLQPFAQAGLELPDWEDFMPLRYQKQPKQPVVVERDPEVAKKTMGGMMAALKLNKAKDGIS
jgi:hypothetical protein